MCKRGFSTFLISVGRSSIWVSLGLCSALQSKSRPTCCSEPLERVLCLETQVAQTLLISVAGGGISSSL